MSSRFMLTILVLGAVTAAVGEELPTFTVEAQVGARHCRLEVDRLPYAGTRTDYWGKDGDPPAQVVRAIRLVVDGTVWPLPPEAFQDLSEVHYDTQIGFDQQAGDGAVVVVVCGGDGAGAFDARLTLSDRQLTRREISSGAGFVNETVEWRDGLLISRVYINSYRATVEQQK